MMVMVIVMVSIVVISVVVVSVIELNPVMFIIVVVGTVLDLMVSLMVYEFVSN